MNRSGIIYFASRTTAYNLDGFYEYILNFIGILLQKGINKAIQ